MNIGQYSFALCLFMKIVDTIKVSIIPIDSPRFQNLSGLIMPCNSLLTARGVSFTQALILEVLPG